MRGNYKMSKGTRPIGILGMLIGLMLVGTNIFDLVKGNAEWYVVLIFSLIGIIVFNSGFRMYNYKEDAKHKDEEQK